VSPTSTKLGHTIVRLRKAIIISLSLTLLVAGAPKRKRHEPKKGNADRARITQISFDPAAINNSATQDPVGPDAVGSAVVRAQILLDRAHFSPGEIDGRYGDNLRVAITGYQTSRNLNPSGAVDADTWKSLNAGTAQLLVPYTITPDDEKGPFASVPKDMMEQAKLDSLGYQSPQEEWGERFHLNPKLLQDLNPGTDLTKAGGEIMVPNVQRENTASADKVVVSKHNRTVSALAADGKVLAQYPATMGSEHDPLPLGDWKIVVIQQNPPFFYNPALFWDAKPEDAKAKIAPGPNNPVGVVWMGLSKEHYGMHGTPEPANIGHTESHGCIRLTNWDAEELSKMVKVGTPAILQE
jgi:lipoprotein-anchoring transpeptidase ErfK/SrfK